MRTNVVCVLGLVACSSSGGETPIVIEGDTFSIAAGAAGVVTQSNGDQYVQILLSSQADLCAQVGSGIQHPDQQTIVIDLGNGSAAATATGAYTVTTGTTGQYANVFAEATDANCQLMFVPGPSGVSGTVTVSSISAGAYTGAFDVMLTTGDHITGSFDAAACPAIGSASDDPTCR